MLAGSGVKQKWICEEGHVYKSSPASRRRGRACPTCAKYGYSDGLPGWIYFLKHTEWDLYKVGITNVQQTRLSQHVRFGWELVEWSEEMRGDEARRLEGKIFRSLKKNGAHFADPVEYGGFSGFTEFWEIQESPANTLSDLIKLTI